MKKRSASTEQKNKRSKKWLFILPAVFMASLVVLWHLAVFAYKVPPYILPTPISVLKALYQERALLLTHTLVTLEETLIGFGASIVLGVLFGFLMGYVDILRIIFYPLFVLTQTIPLIILAPLFAIWFGFGMLPKIIIVIMVCFFPIAVSFAQGLIRVDESMDDLLHVMGASRWKAFALTRIPQALPALFSGLKISATYSVMGAVISEWVGAKEGLGILMTRSMTSFKTSVLFADVLIIILLSLMFYQLVEMIENKVVHNIHPTTKA